MFRIGDNADLNLLLLMAVNHATWLASDGTFFPFVVIESHRKRKLTVFDSQPYEHAVEVARKSILDLAKSNQTMPDMYAIAFDGFATVENVKSDAVIVEAGEKGKAEALVIAQRYKKKEGDKSFQILGHSILLRPSKNMLA